MKRRRLHVFLIVFASLTLVYLSRVWEALVYQLNSAVAGFVARQFNVSSEVIRRRLASESRFCEPLL